MVTVDATADVEAVYTCFYDDSELCSASPQPPINVPMFSSGLFLVGTKGTSSGTITVIPPGPDVNFTCPSGSGTKVTSVQYSNIEVLDQTTGATGPVTPKKTSATPNTCAQPKKVCRHC